jgi:hypothetical protein
MVFVDGVQTDKRIEDQQARANGLNRGGKLLTVAVLIEIEAGDRDDVDGDILEPLIGGCADSVESKTNILQCVFGGEHQHGSGAVDGELTQAWSAGGDRHGDIQGQERFAALGLPAQHADGLFGPQRFDQPALLIGTHPEFVGTLDGQWVYW